MSLVGMNALRDFVAGSFPVPQVPVGLNGLRDFVAGSYPVPQVPVVTTAGMNSLVPSAPTGMTIPDNSVMSAWHGAGMSGVGDCGCGCKGSGGCGSGMGQLSLSTFTAPFTTAFTDIGAAFSQGSISPLTMQDWLVIGGSAAAFWYLFAKKGRR